MIGERAKIAAPDIEERTHQPDDRPGARRDEPRFRHAGATARTVRSRAPHQSRFRLIVSRMGDEKRIGAPLRGGGGEAGVARRACARLYGAHEGRPFAGQDLRRRAKRARQFGDEARIVSGARPQTVIDMEYQDFRRALRDARRSKIGERNRIAAAGDRKRQTSRRAMARQRRCKDFSRRGWRQRQLILDISRSVR